MKKNLLLLIFCSLLGLHSFGQARTNFNKNFESIDKDLKSWDPVRGAWLSNSINAMAHKELIPDRTFPESYTPNQMLDRVPTDVRERISAVASSNVNDPVNGQAWRSVDDFVGVRSCTSVRGRTYGDPHLVSYDGVRYSFQTVGEFVYTKSGDGNVEVQSRQKPLGKDFSLNTAVAMNVRGDRLCIYASDYPDNDYSTPVRLNGNPVQISGSSYFLPNGGTVRFTNKTYVVDWPTGESLTARMSSSQGMRFMDISMNVFPCSDNGYTGLMGNANGIKGDDFNTRSGVSPFDFASSAGLSSADVKRRRQQYLSKQFADEVRITQASSLFDYAIGESTMTFTDRSFPRFYRTIDDLSDVQRQTARRRCEGSGIGAADMEGCIYDNGFLAINPSPPVIIEDPTRGDVLKPITGPTTPNVNPKPQVGKGSEIKNPEYGPQPIEVLITEKKKTTIKDPETEPVRNSTRGASETRTEDKPSRSNSSWGSRSNEEPTRTSTPTRSTPTRSTPTRSTPTRSTPTRSTPSRPTRSTPTRSTPARPTRSTPTRSTPSRPTRSTPTRSGGGIRGRG
jgi:hypothetical protein